jgi:uncharacterized protein YndB with AHSA1/START domain
MAEPMELWSLDREVVLTRLLDHPVDRVFAAWMDSQALAAWYGPAGLVIETHHADLRPGGAWRFDMLGEWGGAAHRFENLMEFVEILPGQRIVADYGTPAPDDPDRFRMTITFDAQDNGKTVLTLRQLHPTPARRRAVIAFGGVEYGMQTLDKLAHWLAERG